MGQPEPRDTHGHLLQPAGGRGQSGQSKLTRQPQVQVAMPCDAVQGQWAVEGQQKQAQGCGPLWSGELLLGRFLQRGSWWCVDRHEQLRQGSSGRGLRMGGLGCKEQLWLLGRSLACQGRDCTLIKGLGWPSKRARGKLQNRPTGGMSQNCPSSLEPMQSPQKDYLASQLNKATGRCEQ